MASSVLKSSKTSAFSHLFDQRNALIHFTATYYAHVIPVLQQMVVLRQMKIIGTQLPESGRILHHGYLWTKLMNGGAEDPVQVHPCSCSTNQSWVFLFLTARTLKSRVNLLADPQVW